MSDPRTRFETLAVHGGESRPAPGGSVVHPVYQGTVFTNGPGEPARYIRLSTNPSQEYLHGKLAALEGTEAAVATASGMAAITGALLAVLRHGDHLIAAGTFYGGTHHFLTGRAERLGWTYDLVDPADPDAWKRALRPTTRALLTESITNPAARVGDLAGLARFGAEHGLTRIIDNTLATPVVFRPHELGYDLVCHSATKALNGHSDLSAGVVTGSTSAVAEVHAVLGDYGGSLDPHAGFLLARGLKTLALRVRQQNANALAVARLLHDHPAIAHVSHPGLTTHPDHERAAALFDGFGSIVSFRPAGGPAASERLLAALRLPYDAASLGGVESLIMRPAAADAPHTPARETDDLDPALIRFSAGIEATEDLIDDFTQALAA